MFEMCGKTVLRLRQLSETLLASVSKLRIDCPQVIQGGGSLQTTKTGACIALTLLRRAMADAAPVRLVTFAKGSEPALTLRAAKAIVYDREAAKQFVADSGFIAKLSGGELRIHAWNPAKSLVRISPRSGAEAWLGCEAIEPSAIACSDLTLRSASTTTSGYRARRPRSKALLGWPVRSKPGVSGKRERPPRVPRRPPLSELVGTTPNYYAK